jgi:hypothetical protein
MSETGAVVYVVGSNHCPSQLLKKVILLIGTLGGGEKGNTIWAVLLSNFLETRGDIIESFVPSRFTELPLLLDERFGQPITIIYKFVEIPALDAEPSLTDRIRFTGQGPHQLPVQNFQIKTTTAPAITTSRQNSPVLHFRLFLLVDIR